MPQPSATHRRRKACVIGAGPNGLAAAIVLAQAGLDVEVFEAKPTIGGATRTMELTLPGFHHDFGSAVHPMAVGSPFFSSLPLENYGLEWIHSPATLAHPLDNGSAVTLDRDLTLAESALGEDGPAWRRLMQPFATHWPQLAEDILRPAIAIPKHPFLLARFGLNALLPATSVARHYFRTEPVRALFAGLAAHSFLRLDQPLSASFGLVLGAVAHAVGWPIPRGGAQSLANALAAHLIDLGGRITTSTRIVSLSDLPACDVTLCDITPRQLLALAPKSRLTETYRRRLSAYKYGPAAFKVDYALSSPIPWNAPACLRAATVHVGGSLTDIATSEAAMAAGHHAERPFVLLAQPTLFDPTPDLEITLEANPTSVERAKLEAFHQAGVNRASLGVQSLDPQALTFLGREHSATQAIEALEHARATFPRVSFDLIYARPGQSRAAWSAELDAALALCADHLSLYQLTIEPGTVFESRHRQGQITLPDDDAAAALYHDTIDTCARHGLAPYEVSNLAKPGAESRHNLAYWRYNDYAGIGPGAHGRITLGPNLIATRRHRAPEPWADRVERNGHGSTAEEVIQPPDRAREMLMMGLRLAEGMDPAHFETRTGIPLNAAIDPDTLERAIEAGYLTHTPNRLTATIEGRLRLDALLAALVL